MELTKHCVFSEYPNCVFVVTLHLWDRFPWDVLGGIFLHPQTGVTTSSISGDSLFIWAPDAEKTHKEIQQRLENRPESSRIVRRESGANYVIDVFVQGLAFNDGRAVFLQLCFV